VKKDHHAPHSKVILTKKVSEILSLEEFVPAFSELKDKFKENTDYVFVGKSILKDNLKNLIPKKEK